MTTPVFEDVEPPDACGCEQCARRRLADAVSRGGSGPAAGGAARAMALAAAAGTAFGGAAAAAVAAAPAAAAAPFAATVHGLGQGAAPRAAQRAVLPDAPLRLSRSQILARARTWTAAKVPYSMTARWRDGYRQDCSGFVSMAWGLDANAWTGDLARYGVRITKAELRPGDILLFHNAADPRHGSHAVVFGGWANAARTRYTGYEQTVPAARVRTTPYTYWTNSSSYVPYRYKYLAAEGSPADTAVADAFPGTAVFGPGSDNAFVTRLGRMLVGRGAAAFYKVGPGPRWGTADRKATAAFQRAQGWSGSAADGLPGPTTWRYLVHHAGSDVPHRGAAPAAPAGAHAAPAAPASPAAPATLGGPALPPVLAGLPAVLGVPGGLVPLAAGAGGGQAADPAAPPPDRAAGETGPGRAPAAAGIPPYPGAAVFRPGRTHDAVLALGRALVARGFGAYYRTGPGRTWTEADRRNVEAFQRAQGWSASGADGLPGPETWRRLFS